MREIYLNGTRECNLNCNYCAVKDKPTGDYETRMVALEGLIRPGDCLILSGGEPLLDQRLLDDVLGLIERHPKTISRLQVFTNGYFLTPEVHKKLLSSGLPPMYIVSADSSEKNFRKLLEANPGVLDFDFRVNYVIAGAEDIINVAGNINLIKGFRDKVGINYNKFRYNDLPFVHEELAEQIRMTSFMLPKQDTPTYKRQCGRVYVNFDGTVCGCDRGFTPEEWPRIIRFQKYFCDKCRYKLYCRNCGSYIRSENYNTCLLTKALCANIEEG